MKNRETYQVYWPRTARQIQQRRLSKRLDGLDGRTIAFLWTNGFRGNEIWSVLKSEIASRYNNVRFIDHDAFGPIHGEQELRTRASLATKLRSFGADAVVAGMGC